MAMVTGGISFGRWYEDTCHSDALKAAMGEFVSTFFFVFAGQGTLLAYDQLTYGAELTPGGLLSVAVTRGFALFVSVAISAKISGGHVNPAVTLGLFVGAQVTFLTTLFYWFAQLLGATIAALLLTIVTGGMPTLPPTLSTGEAVHGALLLEMVTTFGLVYTVYATSVDPRSKGKESVFSPLAIGLMGAANVLFSGAFDGGPMNPALAFGPALVAWSWGNHWVYWVGPLLGAALAGLVYPLLIIPDVPQPAQYHHFHLLLES